MKKAPNVNGREVVVIDEAAALCGVCRRTIYSWLNAGKIQFVRTAGGSVRIFKDSLFRPASSEASTS